MMNGNGKQSNVVRAEAKVGATASSLDKVHQEVVSLFSMATRHFNGDYKDVREPFNSLLNLIENCIQNLREAAELLLDDRSPHGTSQQTVGSPSEE